MAYRLCLVGGGTGGHVYPLIAVARSFQDYLAQQNQAVEFMVLGEGRFLARAAVENNLPFKSILAGKLRRYFSPLTILDIFKFPIGFIQSLWYLYWFMPDAIFSKGGFASVGPGIVAKLYAIPLYIHESDSVPGLSNKILGTLANKVFVAFETAKSYFNPKKVYLVGNPIRKELFGADRNQSLQYFNFSVDKKVILVLGGSLGAKRINDLIMENLVQLVQNYQIIHQCGEANFGTLQSEVGKINDDGKLNNYKLFPFLDSQQLAAAYAACDVIISRAGATFISEIAMAGKPVILIPLPNTSSRGEQITNALELTKFGAVAIEESNLTTHILMNQIENILDPAKYNKISEQIKSFATPDAADKIATEIYGPRV